MRGILNVSLMNKNFMVMTKQIDIHLTIDVKSDYVIADVIFTNNTSNTVYLDSWTICEDSVVRNNIFSIVDENNKHVLYSGPMINRKVLPSDFIPLNPGESINTKMPVNKEYKLLKGHSYKVFFCAYNPTFEGKQQRLDLISNKVEITY